MKRGASSLPIEAIGASLLERHQAVLALCLPGSSELVLDISRANLGTQNKCSASPRKGEDDFIAKALDQMAEIHCTWQPGGVRHVYSSSPQQVNCGALKVECMKLLVEEKADLQARRHLSSIGELACCRGSMGRSPRSTTVTICHDSCLPLQAVRPGLATSSSTWHYIWPP